MSMQANPDESSENSIQYEDICKIVGRLYLDSFHRVQTMENQAANTIEQLRIQNANLIKEAQELGNELEQLNGT